MKVNSLTMKSKMGLIALFLLMATIAKAQIDFGSVNGVRWKPGSPSRDAIVTYTPYIPDGKTQSWAEGKITGTVGANYTSVDITPKSKLVKPDSPCEGLGEGDTCVTNWKNKQYDEVANFIKNSKLNCLLQARVNSNEEFASDMAAVINKLKDNKGIGNLKGVMIGEHESSGRDMLKKAINIVNKINSKTDNWLRDNGVVTLHGGGFGAEFKNIHTYVKDYDTNKIGDQNFLSTMSSKCKGFSFAFKIFKGSMDFTANGMTLTTQQWKDFLWNGTVTANGATSNYNFYLKHVNTLFTNSTYNGGVGNNYKNIIFVGDDADGIANLFEDKTNNSFWAIRKTFDEQDWNGFVFGVPFGLKEKTQMLDTTGGEITATITGSNTLLDLWQSYKTNMSNGRIASSDITDVTSDGLRCYPNPISRQGGAFYIDNINLAKADIRIYNHLGKLVTIGHTISEGKLMFDVSPLASGVYIVKVLNDKRDFQQKIIVKD